MKLSELKKGQRGIIVKVLGRGAFRRRIIEMGFIKGKEVEVIAEAPLKDPMEYKIMDYEVSLRKSEAELVEIITIEEVQQLHETGNHPLILDEDQLQSIAGERSKVINVALVGNPNSGKTSLFNAASGTHERVGNYGGVTVNAKEGKFKYKDYTFNLVDLPGTYSLSAYSPEELYVRKQIVEGTPDIIINVISASNLERNFYLTTQLIDMDAITVIALNMYDELEKSGAQFDYQSMAEMIGCPIVPTVAKSGKGIPELFDQVIEVYERRSPIARHVHINYGKEMETGIKHLKKLLKQEKQIGIDISRRHLSILLLEGDKEAEKSISNLPTAKKMLEERDIHAQYIKDDFREEVETAFADARYGFIAGALKETFKEGEKDTLKITHRIDKIVTHKIWGFPIFFLFLFLTFECTFILGEYPMKWIEWLVQLLGDFFQSHLESGPFKDLLINGIIAGVGSVIVFLPNIVILYLFISFMEDTGYMARAAFIMDKCMHKMGLHGKSFIPLVMGFGCNVPAIMSARIIESRNTRLITMLINPLMSCSARLPVYILFVSAFFPKYLSGFLFFGLYVSGIALAILVSRLLKKFLIKGEDLPFVMELPPYRMPTLKAMNRHTWDRTSQYLKKMGGIILIASIIIWFLEYFPQNHAGNQFYDGQITAVKNNPNIPPEESEQRIANLNKQKKEEQKQNSYIGKIGRTIEPAVRPLGFDWKAGASLISGMAAKEIVITTLSILYVGEENDSALTKQLQNERHSNGEPVYSPLTALSFLFFVLIYFPCIATIAAIKNESGSWKWAAFAVVYSTALAWLVSFSVYQIGTILSGL